MTPMNQSEFIRDRRRHFEGEGFRILDGDGSAELPFSMSASKVRFDVVGVPCFLEEFFIFQDAPRLDTRFMESFGTDAFDWALANENELPDSAGLPKAAWRIFERMAVGRSLHDVFDETSVRELPCLVYVYAVAVPERVSPQVVEAVEAKSSVRQEKRDGIGGFVVPVVAAANGRQLHHFKKKRILGWAYFSEAQKVIKRHLMMS